MATSQDFSGEMVRRPVKRLDSPFDRHLGRVSADWRGMSHKVVARYGIRAIQAACGLWLLLFIVAA